MMLGIWISILGVSLQANANPITVQLHRTIDLNHLGGVPVGLTYDSTDNTFWITNTTGRSGPVYTVDVIHIDQNGTELFRFHAPTSALTYRAISVSSDGSIIHLLGDMWNHAEIFSFSRNGNFTKKMLLTGADLKAPNGLAVASNGDIWVSDFDGSELMKFNNDGLLQYSISLNFTPGNIALGQEEKELYILSLSNPFVHIFNVSSLTITSSIALPPRDTSVGIGIRCGLAISPGYIYVMDTGWKHIEVYSLKPVPEPKTMFIVGLGLIGMVCLRVDRKKIKDFRR